LPAIIQVRGLTEEVVEHAAAGGGLRTASDLCDRSIGFLPEDAITIEAGAAAADGRQTSQNK
jgi:hypothetical protein